MLTEHTCEGVADEMCPPVRFETTGEKRWRRGVGYARQAVVRLALAIVFATYGHQNLAAGAELDGFSFSGDADWFEQYDTTYDGGTAWRSGAITHYGSSAMYKTIECLQDGTLSFYWSVSSESGCDYLRFYIDDVEQASISGSTSWTNEIYSLSAGEHIIKWEYTKDRSVNSGSDCGWVDQIVWEPALPENICRVYFNAKGGTCPDEYVDVECDHAIGSLPTPTREGCRFLGWYTQRVGGERVTSSTVVTVGTTYWAHWRPTYEWKYTPDDVTGTARLDGVEPALEGVVTLPSVLDGYRIVSIGVNAFANNDELEALTVPGNVTDISSRAFANCSGMTCLTVLSPVVQVAGDAFSDCYAVRSATTSGWFGNYVPSVLVTNAVVVSGTVAIDAYAFRNQMELKSVSIPESVTSIGIDAFDNCHEDLYDKTSRPGLVLVDGWVVDYDAVAMEDPFIFDLAGVRGVADGALAECPNLVRVIIPNGFASVGSGAFRKCANLESLVLSEGFEEIPPSAFEECTALVDVMLPQSLRGIGASAFRNCESLQRLVVPVGVTNIAENAFRACSCLANVAVLTTNCVFGANVFGMCFTIREATVSQPVLDSTLSEIFQGSYQNITNVTLAAGVTNISDGAFADCSRLFDLAIPGGVTRIGHNAFDGCAALTNVANAADVGMIGRQAFRNSGLWTFTMPASVTNVLLDAFLNCTDLLRVDVDDMTSWCRIHFANRSANPAGRHTEPDRHCDLYYGGRIVLDLDVPAHVEALGPFTFVENTNIVSVIASPGLTEIGASAFWHCDRLATVALPEGILTIGENTFSGCSELDNLIVPASVIEIGDRAFIDCTSLSRLTLLETQEGIENNSRIGAAAFANCTALTTVTIPSRVTTFGAALFRNCDHLKSVCYLGDFAPVLEAGATDIYEGTPTVMLTYVKQGSAGWVDGSPDLPTVWPNNLVSGRGIRPMPQIVCTVTFDGNGASSPAAIQRDAGQLLGELVVPVRKGYAFDGWFTAANGGARVDDNSVVTANVALYAHWTLLPIYDITFDANGGSGTTVIGIVEGEKIESFPEVFRYGYSVDGWWTSATGGIQVSVDTVVSNTATYWAHWKKSVYDVRFDANDGTDAVTRNVVHGDAVGVLPEPSREGHSFGGWWTAADGGVQVTSATAVYGPVTFWAHWTVNSYVVTFDPADGSGAVRRTMSYGTALGTLPTPERKNYSFEGWWTALDGGAIVGPDTVVTGPITFWAHWKEVYKRLYGAAEGSMLGSAALTYDGYLCDDDGNVKGTIQVKVGKPNAKTGLAAVKATVIGLDGKKKNLKAADKGKALVVTDGSMTVTLVGGAACEVTLGTRGMSGTYGNYIIDGALNVFMSKDVTDKAIAMAALGKWHGAVNVAWQGAQGWNGLSVSIAAKGKANVSGTLADGAKVSASSQMIVGEDWCCVPVVVSRKAQVAFNVWLPKSSAGESVPVVIGLGEDVKVGSPGTLRGGAKFRLDGVLGDVKYATYLPDGVAVAGGAKWTLPKAGKVVYIKGTTTVDDTKAGDNPSALKLTYKAKDGSFKGSFKAYADVNGKPKATTVNVTGVLVDGVGYGAATVKKVGGVPVTVE